MEHSWEVAKFDGGMVGAWDMYICRVCGASANVLDFVFDPKNVQTEFYAFLADGSGYILPDDCAVAKQLVLVHRGQEWIDAHHKDAIQ